MTGVEKALVSLLIEEFVDDSLEIDSLILHACSKLAATNLAVLACFDDGSRTQEREEEELCSPEPPKRKRKRGRKKGPYGPRNKKPALMTFETLAECVLPDSYADIDFKVHFNMCRSTFEKLCTLLAPGLLARFFSVEKKVMVSLWMLYSRESYTLISERFKISKGFLHRLLCSVCDGLSSKQKQYIIMPESSEFDVIASGFQDSCGFPGIIGALGCTHIPIREPSRNSEQYINNEGSFSMQLQVLCDDKLKFIHVYTGCPGNMHMYNIFEKSPLHDILENFNLPPDKHIIGDCSYPLRQYLMVPFREDRRLSSVEEKFNENLAKGLRKVDLSIKVLKQTFSRLRFLDFKQLDDISRVLTAACVLHNYLLLEEAKEYESSEENLVAEGNEYDVEFGPEPCPDDEIVPHALVKRMNIAKTLQRDNE